MSSSMRPVRARSIALPIFLLVIASVLLATLVFFAVTFSGPPPRDPPRGLEGVAYLLRSGHQADGRGPRLQLSERPAPPAIRPGERLDPRAAAALARILKVPPSDVVALTGARPDGFSNAFIGRFAFAWRVAPGRWRIVANPPPPMFLHWHLTTLLAMLATILALSLPGWWIARAISRPLRQLADAADQAGTGAPLPPLPGGSREVQDLSRAVSTMHARLASHAEGRTAMLAGIAHDLGTPLSRLAFWVEQLPEEARLRAVADIEEMRTMLAATLAFARDDADERDAVRIDLGSLLDSLVDDMQMAGAPVALEPGPRAVVRGDSGALRRLFANLVENAIRYGSRASIGWTVEAGIVIVRVDDDGPGIDPAAAERLFQPFVRGEPSRNRATGGTGIGLAIVRSIATRHGGAATLENRSEGGARARVVLPLSQAR